DARRQPFQKAGADNAERDVRRLQAVAGAGHASGVYGAKVEAAGRIQRAAAEADEMRIEFDVGAGIFGMGGAARRVGLPDLDQSVDDRQTLIVPDMAGNLDAFARNAVASRRNFGNAIIMPGLNQIRPSAQRGIAGQIGAALPGQAEMEERP